MEASWTANIPAFDSMDFCAQTWPEQRDYYIHVSSAGHVLGETSDSDYIPVFRAPGASNPTLLQRYPLRWPLIQDVRSPFGEFVPSTSTQRLDGCEHAPSGIPPLDVSGYIPFPRLKNSLRRPVKDDWARLKKDILRWYNDESGSSIIRRLRGMGYHVTYVTRFAGFIETKGG